MELWPVTLGEARAHRYAVWEKSNGYPYDEGYCTVGVLMGDMDFQCSYRIDGRYTPLCRKHGEEAKVRSRTKGRKEQQLQLITVDGAIGGRLP